MWRRGIADIQRTIARVSRRLRFAMGRSALVLPVALMVGCSNPEAPQPPGRDIALEVQAVAEAQPVSLDLRELAEAFAFNARSTSVQRERLEQQMRDAVVRWRLEVHEVMLEDGVYRIVSEPPTIRDAEAIGLLRVVALVHPRSDADRQRIEALTTGDTVEVQGRVQGVWLRTVLTLRSATIRGAT